LAIAALIWIEVPICTEAGTAAKNDTAIGIGGTIVTTADTVFVVSVAAVAVIVTVPPDGIVPGALYVTELPVTDSLELNVPHAPALPHVAVHRIPSFEGLFVTPALNVAEAFTASDAGGAPRNKTATGCVGPVDLEPRFPRPPHPASRPTALIVPTTQALLPSVLISAPCLPFGYSSTTLLSRDFISACFDYSNPKSIHRLSRRAGPIEKTPS
jgi:hypothetical protein